MRNGIDVLGVIGEHTYDRCQLGGDADQPVGMVVEAIAKTSDSSQSAGQEIG
jgi:hypothetical protein